MTGTYRPFNKKRRFGYCTGLMSESFIYNMYYTYFLAFLTDIADLSGSIAGVIIFISILWDAVTDPVIGYYTDRPGVDKRKVMIRAAVPMGLAFIACWLNIGRIVPFVGERPWMQVAYYVIVALSLWLFYTYYTIPYYSVVPELTEDYDERTSIRSLSSLLNVFAVAVGNALPALAGIAVFTTVKEYNASTDAALRAEADASLFATQEHGYLIIAAVIAVLAVIFAVICRVSLSGVRLAKAEMKDDGEKSARGRASGVFGAYLQIIRFRPVIFFTVFVFFFLACSSMVQSNMVYAVTRCIGVDETTGMTTFVIVLVAVMAAVVPLVDLTARKTDRRTASLIFMSIALAGLIAVKLIGLEHSYMVYVQPVVFGIATGTFWTLFYSMAYDIVELDEYVYGSRREGIITAFPQLVQKAGSGTGILLAGQLLTAYGYDSGKYEQTLSAVTVNGIENISTVFPAILLAVSIAGLILYPMTRARFELLKTELEKKRRGEPSDGAGLEKLVTKKQLESAKNGDR